MTGLDLEKDTILEIACFVTDHDLNLLDPNGYEVIIHHDKEVLDQMNEWCVKHHGESGLTAKAIASSVTAEQAADDLLRYIQAHVPQKGIARLAGNSVHADKDFLRKQPYTKVLDHLHYRILDVSSHKEAARSWASEEVLKAVPAKKKLHTAQADILESIEEAKYYRDTFFRR